MIDEAKYEADLTKAVKALAEAKSKYQATVERAKLVRDGIKVAKTEFKAAGNALKALISGGEPLKPKGERKPPAPMAPRTDTQAAKVLRHLYGIAPGSIRPSLLANEIGEKNISSVLQVGSVLTKDGLIDKLYAGAASEWRITPAGKARWLQIAGANGASAAHA